MIHCTYPGVIVLHFANKFNFICRRAAPGTGLRSFLPFLLTRVCTGTTLAYPSFWKKIRNTKGTNHDVFSGTKFYAKKPSRPFSAALRLLAGGASGERCGICKRQIPSKPFPVSVCRECATFLKKWANRIPANRSPTASFGKLLAAAAWHRLVKSS